MLIKLFEEYSSDYVKLDHQKFWELLGDDLGNVLDVSDKEFDKIKSVFKNIPTTYKECDIHKHKITSDKYIVKINITKQQKWDRWCVNCLKLADEWWFVYFDSETSIKYYKCDQLEGMIKLFTDTFIKPKMIP